jgi:AAHS family 4-hydroxybenzoate transporter-like MFS transporter
MPNAAALAAEFVPVARRAIAVTLTIVCVPLGATLAGLIAIPAIPTIGWRALFVLGGVVPIVAALVLFWLLPESPRYLAGRSERWEELRRLLRRMGHPVEADAIFQSETGPEEQQQTRAPLATILEPCYRRDSLALWAAFFSCLLSVYMVFSWLPTILTSAGLGASVASSGITLFNLGGVAGAVSGGFLIGRFGSRPTMLTITGLAIVGAIVLSLMSITSQTSVFQILAMLAFTGGMINAAQTTMFALAPTSTPPRCARPVSSGTVDRTRRRDPEVCGPVGARLSRSTSFFGLMAIALSVTFVALAPVRRHVEKE